jgi:integrase
LQNFNRRVLHPAARRAGLPTLTAYTLRHTAVTRVVERLHQRYHRKELASWAGHSDRVMADTYVRAGVDFDGSELAELDDPVAKRRARPANVVPINRRGAS